MEKEKEQYSLLVKLLLPLEIFEYFTIKEIQVQIKEVHIHLEELDIKPLGFETEKLISKGFHSEIVIQDFPIRDKAMYLHVKRRRWQVLSTGQVISRDWNLVAKGTRLTDAFATFLKGVFGYLPYKQ